MKESCQTRRMFGHNYAIQGTYEVTMAVAGRRPVFGRIVGTTKPGGEAPHLEPSALGKAVLNEEIPKIHRIYPMVDIWQVCLMPDHLHGILFVTRKMDKPLGMAIRGFKQSCNKHYRRLFVKSVALSTQQTATQQTATQQTATQQTATQQTKAYDRNHGLLFAPNYCDKLLLRRGQLDTWLRYLADNPRRLLMKREHPDLFRVRRNICLAGTTFSALGNLFLARRPVRLQVQCSRRMNAADIEAYKQRMLAAARQGAVLVSPSISPGEKAVMRAAFDEGFPLIYLQENGFTDLAKPGGRRMEACASGQLLILAPWEHHNERLTIQRSQCLQLNDMARLICESKCVTG